MKASSAWMAIGVTFLGCSSSSAGGGGSDSAATCGKVAACGGNIVGVWKVVASCGNDNSTSVPSINVCAAATFTNSMTASGTATFKSDMTYTVDLMQSGSEKIVVPMSCLSTSGIACEEVSTLLGGGVQDDAGITMACTISGSNCSCVISAAGLSRSETGTYTVSGNTFTTTAATAGASPATRDYCVQGNTLHAISTTANAMGMPDSDLVATKE